MKKIIALILLTYSVNAQQTVDLLTAGRLYGNTGAAIVTGNNNLVTRIQPPYAYDIPRANATKTAIEFFTPVWLLPADTFSLSARINLKLNATDTASLSSRINSKQNTITTGSSAQYLKGDLSLGNFPTTISGYGITDFNSLGDARWSLLGHVHSFASLTGTPTTLSGYGITDAYPISGNPSGFLTSFTEADPIYSASSWFSTTNNASNWDNAYTNRITSLTTTGSGAATLISNVLNIPTPSSSSPGGSSTNIQFNNGGIFAGSANLVWDNTNGQLGVLSAGSAALPNVAVGQTDLGFYKAATDELAVSTGGAERFRFSSTYFRSPTTGGPNIRRAAGAASTPTYAFNGTVNTGMWLNGTSLAFSVNGVNNLNITTGNVLQLNNPANTFAYSITPTAIGGNYTLNLPTITATDELVAKDVTQTLANKTMTGATNVLTASLLKSATTEVDVSASTAPSSGQVLTATSSTTATWQTPSGGGGGGSGTVTSVTSADANITVATTTTTPVITLVQAPALKSATTTVDVSAATAPTSGQALKATSSTTAVWENSTTLIETFTSNGTWTKASGAKVVYVMCIGGGGGGGSGRKGAAGTIRCGGGGGGSGGVSTVWLNAASLGATETITIGTGGAGGASQTTNSTNGINGGSGTVSTFGTKVRGYNGANGNGGSATAGAGGQSASCTFATIGNAGAAANTLGNSGAAGIGNVLTSTGGGSGGGITAANVASAGGGANYTTFSTRSGISGGAIATNGNNGGAIDANFLGTGGSGGGSSLVGAGGTGGSGTVNAGGGGGGGGSSVNDIGNSGAGGAGGSGVVIVITYF